MRPTAQEFRPDPAMGGRRLIDRAKGVVVPAYRVGEPFRRGRRGWCAGAEFTFGPAGAELTLFQPGSAIPPEVVEAAGRGPAEFALIVRPSVLVLAYCFGGAIPWDDAPYAWHLQPEDRRSMAFPNGADLPEARALIWITLVGAEDGIIRAQRGMTLAPSFTRAMYSALRDQVLAPFDADDCTAAIASIYLGHSDTVDRLPLAVARTLGNS